MPRASEMDKGYVAKIAAVRRASLDYAMGKFANEPAKFVDLEPPNKKKQKASKRRTVQDQIAWRKRYEDHLASPEWAAFRKSIIKARGRMCQRCKEPKAQLDLHHKHYKTLGKERPRDVKLLCRACHEAHHGKQMGGAGEAARGVMNGR